MKKCSLLIVGLVLTPFIMSCQKSSDDQTTSNKGTSNARGVAVIEMANGKFADVACAKRIIQAGGDANTIRAKIEQNCAVEENQDTSSSTASARGFWGGSYGSYYSNYLSYYAYRYPVYYYSYYPPSYSQTPYCGYMFGINYCYSYFGYPSTTGTTSTTSSSTSTSSSSSSTTASTDCNAACTYSWSPTRCMDRCRSRIWW